MMLRSLTVAALMLAGSGVACAQSVYLYVAPGASVYVTPTGNARKYKSPQGGHRFRDLHAARIAPYVA